MSLTNYSEGKDEIVVKINQAEALSAGISAQSIGMTVNARF